MKTYRIIAKGVVAAEMALFPLLFVAFLLSGAIASISQAMGAGVDTPPSIWFLSGQYSFFYDHGLISPRVIVALHLFALFSCLSIVIAVLRLITGPAGFDVADWRKVVAKQKLSVPKLVAGGLLIGLFGIPGSLSIQTSSSIPALRPIIFSLPAVFIGIETLVFVCGAITLAEGTLGCIQLFLTSEDESADPADATRDPRIR